MIIAKNSQKILTQGREKDFIKNKVQKINTIKAQILRIQASSMITQINITILIISPFCSKWQWEYQNNSEIIIHLQTMITIPIRKNRAEIITTQTNTFLWMNKSQDTTQGKITNHT